MGPPTPLRLGPYELLAPIGAGAMGRVWRARHLRHDLPVAVKVITGEAAVDPVWQESFRHEVRAVARLDHPGVVLVLDHGEIEADLPDADLRAGSPYLVTELASGGSLSGVKRYLPWPQLRDLLLRLLDALAHAHARGVIHRDLKPGNVLLSAARDVRPGPKLADFGIAHALDGQDAAMSGSAGTPRYMAPEQVAGDWRAQGPWTDLYALGCLAWRQATGRTPFADLRGPALLNAQLHQEPGLFDPGMPVPGGLEPWLRRLLAKSPADRFRRAADAAAALLALGSEGDQRMAPLVPDDLDPHGQTVLAEEPTVVLPAVPSPRAIGRARQDAPPIPGDWRHAMPAPAPFHLVNASLGLFGLRTVPLVGREAERDALWEALKAVHQSRRVHVAWIRGAAGTGKTRLAEWLVQRAHEVGAADGLRAAHAPDEPPLEPIRRMVTARLRCRSMTREQVRDRVEAELGVHGPVEDWERDALVRLVVEGRAAQDVRTQHVVVRRLLARLASERPLVLVLDDVVLSGASVALVEALVEQGDGLPVLIVLTSRGEAASDRPKERARLEALRGRTLDLGALGRAERNQLVEGLLGLEPGLAARVDQRTAGNPAFTVQLVTDWVARGLLEARPGGFALRSGGALTLPDDPHRVWSSRIEQVIEGQPEDGRIALERAAVLGLEVDAAEWAAATADLAVSEEGRRTLRDRLLGAALAEDTPRGFAFAQPLLRESLLRTGREAGRERAHHRACAEVVRRAPPSPTRAERLGAHLLAGGAVRDALDPLFEGVRERSRTSGFVPALALLASCEEAMAAIPASDPSWARLREEKAQLLRFVGSLEEAEAEIERGLADARRFGWPSNRLAYTREVIRVQRGDPSVEPALYALLEQVDAEADPYLRGRVLQALAVLHRARGDLQGAAVHLDEALAMFRAAGDPMALADALRLQGDVQSGLGAYDRALTLVWEAMQIFEPRGYLIGVAYCLGALADAARHQGDLEQAEIWARRAHALLDGSGDAAAITSRYNLAAVELARGRLGPAREAFEALVREERAAPLVTTAAHASLLPCVAASAEWRAWDRHLERALTGARELGLVDRDLAWSLEEGGRLALRSGQRRRGRAALEAAAAQWAALGRDADRDRVEAGLEGLG